MLVKAVLFDLDNTLLIRRPTIPEKWCEVLCRAGYAVTLRDTERAFAECEMWVGRQVRLENETGVRLSDEQFKVGVMGCGGDALGLGAEAIDMLAPGWMGKYDMRYELADGAVELLGQLRDRGTLLGIVSNNRPSIRKTLEDLDLAKYFDVVVISEEVGLYKPDPAILLYACEKLNVRPEETLYVGDHPYDVVCAQEASVHAAWIPVNGFMELPEGTNAPLYCLKALEELNVLLRITLPEEHAGDGRVF